MNKKKFIPWVEKYRPLEFASIVLSIENEEIFKTIFIKNYMPNLLLYGPPGTGKTTTIINLIKEFQKNNKQENQGLMIHLNASDERGIDTIRNQINSFVNSKPIFNKGIKFIILDEVDYMTKNAQQALKYLLQEYKENIRFCLICNYISKIDESLQNELVKLRFNQLPGDKIKNFLDIINNNEYLNLDDEQLSSIQHTYGSDLRSMINYMQSNQKAIKNFHIMSIKIYEEIDKVIKQNDLLKFLNYIQNIVKNYNIDSKTLIKDYITYLIRNSNLNSKLLTQFEYIIHNAETNSDYQLEFLFYSLQELS